VEHTALIPLAKYGVREIVLCTAILLPAAILSGLYLPRLAPVFGVLLAWVFYFFRDPRRSVPQEEGLVVAPADGTITHIDDCEECEYVPGPALRISIFLSVFNVHINRAPVAGKVKYLKYRSGRFLNAMRSDSSQENESNSLGLETEGERPVRMLVKQIAGAIARRIVCDCRVDDTLGRGEKFGMIKFGSRTDLFLPKAVPFEVQVQVGQKVAAGKTILGCFR